MEIGRLGRVFSLLKETLDVAVYFPPEPIPVLSPNRLRFLVVATITGALLALTVEIRVATTGLRIFTLPRPLTTRTSSLRTSILGVESTMASASQSVVFLTGHIYNILHNL